MGSGFRLMTANLLNGRADGRALANTLDRVKPDVVVTQELGPDAAQVIATRYPYHDLHPGLNHEGRGIATRFGANFGRLSLPWRAGSWARVDVEGSRLLVASVHLINPIDFPWWVSGRRRQDQFDALVSWVDDRRVSEALVVAGDMNATPRWGTYRQLATLWDDLVLTAARSSEAKAAPTWGWRPGWPRMLRIDHVFGEGVGAIATSVEPIRGSDHAALVVDLELK